MNGVTWIHVAAGMLALASGSAAAVARKGGATHMSAGMWFCVSMLVLGVTAVVLAPFKSPPDSPLGGIMVCYFVATAWMTARRRSGRAGMFEKLACAIVLLIGIATIGEGLHATLLPGAAVSEPPGPAVLFIFGGICLLAGLLDLRFILRGELSTRQRIARHLWRMCFAFFIATGSFFLGQQDVMPQAVRGSPILIVAALAPLALMLFWLAQTREPGVKHVTNRL